MRGAWIEIVRALPKLLYAVSLPVRGAWIEIPMSFGWSFISVASLPVRGAWIEIPSRL